MVSKLCARHPEHMLKLELRSGCKRHKKLKRRTYRQAEGHARFRSRRKNAAEKKFAAKRRQFRDTFEQHRQLFKVLGAEAADDAAARGRQGKRRRGKGPGSGRRGNERREGTV